MPTVISAGRPAILVARPVGPAGPPGPPGPAGPEGGNFIQAGTGANTWTMQDKVRERFSVKDFGATGDGTTIDGAAINEAILALIAAGGGELYFPRGIYRTDSVPLVIDLSATTVRQLKHIQFRGEGINTKIFNPVSAVPTLSYLSRAADIEANFTIENMLFTGNLVTGSQGINLTGAAFVTFRNVVIEGFDIGMVATDIEQSGFHGCIFRYCNRGVALQQASANAAHTDPNSVTFVDCCIGSNYIWGLLATHTNCLNYIGGSFQYNGTIAGGGAQWGCYLEDAGSGYGTVNFTGVAFEGNGGLGDFVNNQTSYPVVVTFTSCGFMRADYTASGSAIGYGTGNITATGTGAGAVYVLSGNSFRSVAPYAPNVTRKTIWLNNTNAKILDDGTNYFQNAVEQLAYPDAQLITLGARNGAWALTHPAVTGTGTPGAFAGTCNMHTLRAGKMVSVQLVVNVTNIGTATAVSVPFPVAPIEPLFLNGSANNAYAYQWFSSSGSIFKFDSSTTPVAQVYYFSGTYEAA